MNFLLLFLWVFTHQTSVSDFPMEEPVSEIIAGVPLDISEETLMIPRFDLLDPEEGVTGRRRKFIASVNRAAKSSNTTLFEIIEKNYPYEYKMVGLSNVEEYQEDGYRYFLDMVLMPKQMKEPKVEAMIPSFEKFNSANRMYNNRNSQFHYYFYIRDLETNKAYITTRFKGTSEAYPGIKYILKQIKKETSE